MKKINFVNLCMIAWAISFSIVSCKSDDDGGGDPKQNAEKEALEKYSGEWEAVSVTKDGANYEGYEDFVLKISEDKKFQASGDPNSVFPTGSFQFIEGSDYKKVICNGVEVSLTASGNNLVASFSREQEGSSAGRIQGIAGNYKFNLKAVE